MTNACKLTVGGWPTAHETLRFAGGEMHIRIVGHLLEPAHMASITAHLHSSDAIMEMLLLTDAVRRRRPNIPIELVCPYFPYARQDRVCVPGEALSARVMADLVNAQNYCRVEVWDPHSSVTAALVDRISVRPASDFAADFAFKFSDGWRNAVLIAPDAGAVPRVVACAKELELPFITAHKTRNPQDGSITETALDSIIIDRGPHIMVDDICDGGRTFVEIAKLIRARAPTMPIALFVTHGIFSRGFEPFYGLIDQIYAANCWHEASSLPDFVHILEH